METLYLWPDRPALSLLVCWAISAVALWAARDAMRELFERLGKGLEEACGAAGHACQKAAAALHERSRTALLAVGGLELQGRLEKELRRVERGFSERLGQYSILHRKLDELVQRLERDYQESGSSPPDVPGWTAAVESIASLPSANDPSVKEILAGVQKSLDEAQRQALHAYRADTAERHEILDRMRSVWKEVQSQLAQTREAVGGALETAARVDAYVDQYARVRDDDRAAALALSRSATKRFVSAALLLLAGLGGAFANQRLLEGPLAALLPHGASLGGVSVAAGVALAMAGLALALGMLAVELLGLSEAIPRLGRLGSSQRRLGLAAACAGLLLLAVAGGTLVERRALGFALPWLVALAALPLEGFLQNGRHVALRLGAAGVNGLGSLAFVAARTVRTLCDVLPNLYDAYVSIPLRIEGAVKRMPSRRRLQTREEVVT